MPDLFPGDSAECSQQLMRATTFTIHAAVEIHINMQPHAILSDQHITIRSRQADCVHESMLQNHTVNEARLSRSTSHAQSLDRDYDKVCLASVHTVAYATLY